MRKILSEIDKAIEGEKNITLVILKNAALLLDIDDDIIKESLTRKIWLILQKELVTHISKVKSIGLSKDNNIVLEIKLALALGHGDNNSYTSTGVM